MNAFKRQPCRTDHEPVPKLVTLDDWRSERDDVADERRARIEREQRRREQAEIEWRRRQLPWPLRVLAGFIDMVREWRGR